MLRLLRIAAPIALPIALPIAVPIAVPIAALIALGPTTAHGQIRLHGSNTVGEQLAPALARGTCALSRAKNRRVEVWLKPAAALAGSGPETPGGAP